MLYFFIDNVFIWVYSGGMNMKKVNYHLTEIQIKGLRTLSDATGLSVAEIIRRAVDEYLSKRTDKLCKE